MELRASPKTMTDKTFWDTLKGEGDNVVEKLKELVHEGNVRRVVIQHGGRTIAEFPLTAGIVGAVLAPMLAAVAASVALMKDCTIQVERNSTTEKADKSEARAGAEPKGSS